MTLGQHYPFYLAGEAITAGETVEIANKSTGETAATLATPTAQQVERAIASAHGARDAMRALKQHERRAILEDIAARIEARRDDFAEVMAVEAGKPISLGRAEVTRCVDTFREAADEATRLEGGMVSLGQTPRGDGYEAWWKPQPIGACLLISPFNFPLNLAAHKVAPAIAAGCPWVLKPTRQAPITAMLLAEVIAQSALPKEAWSVLTASGELADKLVEDERFRLLTFTGSGAVGWKLRDKAKKKHVVLELGGVACTIIDESADLERAAERIATGAFAYSGQSCISVQRVLAHESVRADLRDRLVERVRALKVGDVMDEATQVGPMISLEDAERVEQWVREAEKGGGKVLIGGKRDGRFMHPTIVENPARDAKVACEEVFGPVCTYEGFTDLDEAFERVNALPFGLQAGIFTSDIDRAMRAWDALEVGGVVVNDVPTSRVDAMPYGGVKDSGMGREGVRSSIRDMTEQRLMLLKRAVTPSSAAASS